MCTYRLNLFYCNLILKMKRGSTCTVLYTKVAKKRRVASSTGPIPIQQYGKSLENVYAVLYATCTNTKLRWTKRVNVVVQFHNEDAFDVERTDCFASTSSTFQRGLKPNWSIGDKNIHFGCFVTKYVATRLGYVIFKPLHTADVCTM